MYFIELWELNVLKFKYALKEKYTVIYNNNDTLSNSK